MYSGFKRLALGTIANPKDKAKTMDARLSSWLRLSAQATIGKTKNNRIAKRRAKNAVRAHPVSLSLSILS